MDVDRGLTRYVPCVTLDYGMNYSKHLCKARQSMVLQSKHYSSRAPTTDIEYHIRPLPMYLSSESRLIPGEKTGAGSAPRKTNG
jgi:hypothetical protein